MSVHAESVPRAWGCSLSALNTGLSSVELTGVSEHNPEHIPSVWPVRPQGFPSSVLQPKVSIPACRWFLVSTFPQSSFLCHPKGWSWGAQAMVSMAGAQVCGELWGPPESLLG